MIFEKPKSIESLYGLSAIKSCVRRCASFVDDEGLSRSEAHEKFPLAKISNIFEFIIPNIIKNREEFYSSLRSPSAEEVRNEEYFIKYKAEIEEKIKKENIFYEEILHFIEIAAIEINNYCCNNKVGDDDVVKYWMSVFLKNYKTVADISLLW